MIGKNNLKKQYERQAEKVETYSIKKFKAGAASVLIGVGLFFGAGIVEASDSVTVQQNGDKNVDNSTVTSVPVPSIVEAKPVEKKAENTREKVVGAVAEKVNSQTSEKTQEVDKSLLLLKVEELKSQLERIKNNTKQQSMIDDANSKLASAESILQSSATQQEVDKKVKELSSFTSILKSIKAEETPKENKNTDSRNGKKMQEGTGFRAGEAATTPPTTTGVGADVVDATATPAVEKTSFTDKEAAKAISKQIAWLDFGDVANWTNLGSGSRLKVGSTYTKEVMPGYHVTIKVKSLKPFQATEIYRKRMEAMGATDEEKATFDPNATNGLLHIDGLAEVSATDQGDYSEIKKAGIIDAGTRKISIGSTKDGANIGVQFEISGTYKGRTVRPSVVMLDSESNDFGENIIFTTNGRGWEKVLEINKNVSNPKGYVPINNFESPKNLAAIGRYQPGVLGPRTSETAVNIVKVGSGKIAAKYLTNPDRVTGGLGTGVFGPVATAVEFSIPVVMTRDASEVGLYILTGGQQRSMMGIAPIDEGDAPESYGGAFHMISTKNGLTGAEVNQPYLGSERPDMDTNNTKDWLGDDKSPEANNDPHADEGINQILPDNLKNVDRQIIKLDRTNGHYTYSLDIQAHTDGAPQAHIYGWIDFNNNGKFDEDERSELATITNDSTVTLHFNRSFTEVDPKLVELGTRVRIATNAKEIEKPTGVAFSGEVEDFKTQITHPPRGEQVRTEDRPRITQSGHITFTALGKVAYKVTEDAEIRTDIPPVYIDNKTGHPITLPADGIYTVAGQGTYKITLAANNKDVDVQFTPEDGFVGEAHGITIRRQDTNDATTGWINRNTNTSMDGLYIPKVVVTGKSENASSSNLQGLSQSGTPVFRGEWNNNPATPTATNPAKLVDPRTNEVTGATTVDALDSNNNKIGTYTIKPLTGEVTFTPKKDFTGTPIPAIVSLDLVDGHDKDGQPATTLIRATYSPTVIPITPQAEASTTSGVQGKPQTSPISLNTPDIETNTVNFNKGSQEGPNGESVELDATTLTLLDGDGHEVTSVTIPQQGKYELNKANKTITFTPNKDFVGPATPVKVQIKDVNGTKVETTYTPTVTDVTMESKDKTSEAPQGKTQTGTPEFKVSDPNVQISGYKLVDPVTKTPVDSTEIEVPNEGTYKIDKTTGQVTFIPKPEFKGPATGITVQATDENGETKDAKYTPSVTPITVTPGDKTTKDIQGVPQSETPTFTIPDGVTNASITSRKLVDPTNNQPTDSVTLEGKGTFTINGNGKVTFTPVPSYTGDVPAIKVEATITVTNEKNESTTITSTANYKPVIVPVEIEKTPAESTNLQGLEQTGRPTFTPQTVTVNGEQKTVSIKPNSYKLVKDGVEVPTTPAYKQGTTEEIGTYTINASTGEVTFTPIDKTYTGPVEPAVVQATGSNGSKVNTTYTPSITPVSPTAEKSATSGVQGKPQTSSIVLDTKETGDDKGMTVNFNKGTEEGPNGERVNLDPATLTLLDSSNAPVDSVTTPQGKYELNKANKTITFTPNKDFVGPATPVKVQIKDANGTKVETTYTPTVEEVTPTGKDSATTGPQGVAQTSPIVFNQKDEEDGKTVNFDTGHKLVAFKQDTLTLINGNGEKVTTITVPEVGTYELKDGAITFTPVKTFKGTTEGVTVQIEDENGKVVTKKYVPTVEKVTPTGENSETEGPKAQPQTSTIVFDKKDVDNSTVNFNKGHELVALDPTTTTLVGRDGSPATEVTISGEGTYTLANNIITFTPESDFAGKATGVTVQVKDANGTVVAKTYTPTVRPITEFKDKEGNTIPGSVTEDGRTEKKDFPEYRFIETKVDEKGNTKHIYEKVSTFFKDKEGNELPNTPSEKGTVEKKEVPEYRFVETKKLPNGDTEHVYEKVSTFFKDKEGNELPNTPSEKGTVEKKEVPEYRFVETKKLPNGDTEHVYEKVSTFFKDKEGNELPNTPSEKGTVEKKEVPEYRFVETKKLPNGDTEHVYEKVSTFFKDKEGNELPNTPSEKGTVEKKEVPEYRFVETKKLPNGDTEHVYEKVSTFFKDKEGNELPNTPSEKGTVEKKEVPEYRFVETKKLPNGDTEHVYEKVSTFFKDKEGNELPNTPSEKGTVEKKEVPEYRFVETKKLPNGDTEHVYEKVSTFFKDKEGNELPNTPSEKGTIEKKEVPEYRFVETKKLPNGDTEHVYEKVSTFFKDKEGNELPNTPSEKGTVEKKEVPEYRFVETKKLPNGDTEHVYEKVSTFFKDKEGNELPNTPSEKGTVEKKEVPEYRFVETKKLPNGDTEHVYEKVSTFFKDKEGNELPNTPSEKGTVEKKEVPEYRFVETKKLPNGDTEHVYEKVSTFFKDKEGNELPNTPSEKGTVEKKEVPEYRFVETKKLPNGDTEHVYEKVSTFFKDKEGNELPNTPSEKGTVEKKEVPEYRFVETKKLPNGDTEHVYEKVSTFFKDKEGNELPNTPSEKGTIEKKEVPEYRFVETKKLPNGDTEHVYEKVSTFFKDKEGNELPNTPSEKGTVEKKEVPEYRFVETKKLPNGDTEHVYEKVSTFFKDKEGNELPNTPSEKGTVEKKEVPEYRFVETKKDEKGNTIHVYTKKSSSTPESPKPSNPESPKPSNPDSPKPSNPVSPKPSTPSTETKTSWKDKEGNIIPGNPTEAGEQPNKAIPGYKFVETKKLPNGDTEHVYEKVTTSYKDKEGNVIPGNPTEAGEQPNKAIPGYKFVETKKLPNGDIEHVYEKVTTSYKNKEGNVISGNPTEAGEQPNKAIPGYKFVETKKLPNGDTEHVYEKVTTSYKDKEGNIIPGNPTEAGEQPNKAIPGYKFVETKKLPNGDTEHVYEKVTTSYKDKEGNVIPGNPTEAGEQPNKAIPGYKFVETKKLPNGDVEHVYEKVKGTTTWVDEYGNILIPKEEGILDPSKVSGYEFVRTDVDKEGNVRHVFKKVSTSSSPVASVTTSWTDEEGTPIKVSEKGTRERGEVPGYEYVRTVIEKDGNVHHIFRKVTSSTPKAQVKRLANTGTTETNTGLAGLGLALFGGLLAATKRRKNK